jgi:hypothetical protein
LAQNDGQGQKALIAGWESFIRLAAELEFSPYKLWNDWQDKEELIAIPKGNDQGPVS